MDTTSYVLAKKYTNLVAIGLASASVDDVNKSITFTLAADGSQHTIHFNQPSDGQDGVSVTGVSDKGNGVFTLLLSDGSESDPIQCVKGEDGFSPTATVEKVGKVATITITDKNGTTTATIKDGEGSEGGEANVIDSISVNGVNVVPDENKNVDITVPSIDGLAKTEDIPTKVSELTNDSGYLTEHQDISGKVDKVEGKSLISDTEIARLATVDNYDDTDIKAEIAKKADATVIPSKVSDLENDSKYQTESDVTTTLTDYATKTYVGEQITNAEHLKREIVTVLPSDTEASDNIIYMLKVESATGNDKYQEYMKIDGTVQMVGDTSVDLTDYAKSVDIPTTVAELTDSADYAKKTDLHSHTNKTVLDGITEEKVTAWDKAQENIIESVKINDQEITPDENKAVNIDLTGYAEHNEIVGENLIPFPYADGMSKTMNGIEYTVNPDGSVTAVGTAIETSAFVLAKSLSIDPNATYILSGDLDDEITYKSSSILFNAETSSGASYWNYGKDKPVIFTGISVLANFRIRVTKDETVNQTFYPMLEIGNIPHKYQQYKLSRNNLREDIDELKKLDDKLENQFNIASGDYITLTDSVDGNIVELGVKGNSYQKQLQGYNLIPFPYYSESGKSSSGLTFTYGDDFNITVNGTISSSYAGFAIARNIKVDAVNKKYMLIGLPTTGSGTTHKLRVRYIFPDGTTSDFTNCYNVNGNILDKKDSTYEGATMEIDLMCYDDKDNFQVRPMLVEVAEDGSYPTEYEAYCGGIPAPNPSYPQTINSVGDDGSLVVTSCGKNLLKNTNGNNSSQGITYTKNSDGSISCTGTQIEHSYYMLNNDLEVDFKGKYILSGNTTTNSNEWGYCLFLQLEIGDNQFNYIFNNTPDEVVCDFSKYPTLRRVRPYIRVGKNAPALTNKTVTFYPMLRPYGTDGTYEPYKESTTTIPLSEPLRAIGDVKDEITYQDDKWGVLRRIKETIIDSATKINPAGALTGTMYDIMIDFGTIAQDSYSVVNKVSDVSKHIFSNFQSKLTWNEDVCGAYISWAGGTFARMSSSICGSTLDEVNLYLKDNPITMDYVLATPVFEPFADQTLPYLSTYDGVTNISNDDALSAEMTVKYPTTDASGVGSRNESRIAELAKDTDDKFDDVNESLSVIGKRKNLLNSTLQTTTQNGVTCANNGDGTYTLNGTPTQQIYFHIGTVKLTKGKTYKIVASVVNNKDTFAMFIQDTSGTQTVWETDNDGIFTAEYEDYNIHIRCYSGNANNILFKPMLTTDLSATYDDFVPYTGDGDTLTHDVAEIKNNLSVKKFELVAGVLWLCVCGKHCVLTLNGYNLTEPTHFDKLEEYQPYLVARNVVSKGDGVCIAAVEPNGNINASDLVVGTSLTGQLFGEISWIANI